MLLPLKRILCPTDYSEPSYIALQHASEMSGHFGAELLVLHVVPTLSLEVQPGVYALQGSDVEHLEVSRRKLQTIIAERVPQDVTARAIVRSGNAADEIARAAQQEEVDMVVLATHGLTGWRHLVFGSVSERVLRLIRCPILIVHPPKK